MLMNGQLAWAVFAPAGTMAAVVMREMERVNTGRRKESGYISLEFSLYNPDDRPPEVGLVLEPDHTRGYTIPAYQEAVSGAIVAFIGEGLPEEKLTSVARLLLTFLKPCPSQEVLVA